MNTNLNPNPKDDPNSQPQPTSLTVPTRAVVQVWAFFFLLFLKSPCVSFGN